MRKIQTVLFTGALALSLIPFSSFNKVNQNTFNGNVMVTGGGTTEELGEKSTFTINAILHKNGNVSGHVLYQFRGDDHSYMIKIDCLTIVGNKARVSGVVYNSKGDLPWFVYDGERAAVVVQDKGQPNDAGADLISDIWLGGGVSCNTNPTPYLPIQGNIDIKQ